jgi:energy-coupling factor transporter ATP-binding protein EcfA2
MRISQVAFRNFPPFADAIVEFPPSASDGAGEVHLLTGQNGTGKTRLLCLLAAACGNSNPLIARLGDDTKSNVAVVSEDGRRWGVWKRFRTRVMCHLKEQKPKEPELLARTMSQSSNVTDPKSLIQLWTNSGMAKPRPDLVAALAFRGMAKVSDATISALAPVDMGLPADHLTFEPAENEDQIICQSVANLVMGAAMDTHRRLPKAQSRATQILERLEGTLSRITGREFSFEVTPPPEVRLRVLWGSVPMTLLQLPDGLRAIIGWLVSCVSKLEALFPKQSDPLSVSLILLLDEPEGHLHPAWQRKVLPAAQMLFPQAQIFAATHSPFVISSVNDGWVHIFRADEAGVVTIEPPRECSKGDTYLDVVEDILGVKEWYDPETESLLAKFRETRDAVFKGSGDFDSLEGQAEVIASRSASLRDLMAREMRQVERLTTTAGVGT